MDSPRLSPLPDATLHKLGFSEAEIAETKKRMIDHFVRGVACELVDRFGNLHEARLLVGVATKLDGQPIAGLKTPDGGLGGFAFLEVEGIDRLIDELLAMRKTLTDRST